MADPIYPITKLPNYQMRLKRTYGSREVAALTGLSARQLQIWDAGGLLSPAIPSHKTAAGGYTERRYTPIELFELLVLGDLRRRGRYEPLTAELVADAMLENRFDPLLAATSPQRFGVL